MYPCVPCSLFVGKVQYVCVCEVSCVRQLWGRSDRLLGVLDVLSQSSYSSGERAIFQSEGAGVEGLIRDPVA